MRERDLADSSLASHRQLPSDHCDSLRDLLVEPILSFQGPVPTTPELFRNRCIRLLDDGLEQAREAGEAEKGGKPEVRMMIVKMMQLFAVDADRRLAVRAACCLRLMGMDGRSFQEIGDYFGLCRAAVQGIYRQIQQQHPELRSRGDKSDSAREACRRRRLGVRKARIDWPTASQWNNPTLPLPLLLSR